jgi:hypothetical protein
MVALAYLLQFRGQLQLAPVEGAAVYAAALAALAGLVVAEMVLVAAVERPVRQIQAAAAAVWAGLVVARAALAAPASSSSATLWRHQYEHDPRRL